MELFAEKGVLPGVVLASGSPRRQAILREHGVCPVIVLPTIDETLPDDLAEPAVPDAVMELAQRKARDVASKLLSGEVGCDSGSCVPWRPELLPDYLIVAADTVVFKDRILGKPANRHEATAMLQSLRGTAHRVYTGVALLSLKTGACTTLYDATTVVFKDYSQAAIEEYIAQEPPFDKAGSYGIQGMWGAQVARIEGDLENVIGLPWHKIAGLIPS
ncbi:MAG: Maf family protein [Coriobacteriales bacterium]|nr:Maf family protein [Coriobacteriales bacterium]